VKIKLKKLFVSIFCFLALTGLYDHTGFCQSAPGTGNSQAPDAAPELKITSKPWYQGITTRWGGRIRTTGVASRITNDTIYEPVGTGTYYDTATSFRLTNETFFSDTVISEIHYQLIGSGGDTVRKQNELSDIFPGLPDNLLFLGTPLNDDRRLMDLTDTIKDGDSWFLVQRLDRLYLSLLGERASLRAGRQAITWGNGFVFNPMDLFNPFPPTTIDRDYKAGDDMINVQLALAEYGDLQLLYVARRNPDNEDVELDQASLAGKWHFALGNAEFDAMASRHFEDYVVGAGSRGYLGDTAWRLDATWTYLKDGGDYLSLVGNLDYSWVWFKKNFYGFIEYYYNGLGKNDYDRALLDPAVIERLTRGEIFALGQNYLSGHVQVELHPLFKLTLTSINNVEDPSGIIQPYAVWDILQDLQMTAGLAIHYGEKGSEFGGFKLPGTDLRNRPPDSAYLWFIYYF
jgi:hypothetical protein